MAVDLKTQEVVENILEEASKVGASTSGTAAPSGGSAAPAQESRSGSMDLLGVYEGEEIDSGIIFSNEGLNLRQNPRRESPQYKKKLAEVATFYKKVLEGRIPLSRLAEAMTTDDFPELLGDTLDRVLLAKFATFSPSYRTFLRTRTVPDFRNVGSVRRHGGKGLKKVAQRATYPQAALEESSYEFRVYKYGMTYSISWEMIINDDLEAFRSLPDDMADDAIQEEMQFASSLYVANATLYSATHAVDGVNYSNTDTAALSIEALKTAYNNMLKYPGDGKEDGKRKPVNNTPIYLTVPPVLRLLAVEILGNLQVQWIGGDATASTVGIAKPTNNALAGELSVVVDPYIPIIDPTNGHTSWYLFANPNGGLHAAEVGFLRGYEQPQTFMRRSDAVRMGGGDDVVDFDTDSKDYKVRHVFGGSHANAAGNWRGTYRSTGAG